MKIPQRNAQTDKKKQNAFNTKSCYFWNNSFECIDMLCWFKHRGSENLHVNCSNSNLNGIKFMKSNTLSIASYVHWIENAVWICSLLIPSFKCGWTLFVWWIQRFKLISTNESIGKHKSRLVDSIAPTTTPSVISINTAQCTIFWMLFANSWKFKWKSLTSVCWSHHVRLRHQISDDFILQNQCFLA